MQSFVARIYQEGEEFIFEFSPLLTPEGLRFFVTLKGVTSIPFQMEQKRPGIWVIIEAPKVPQQIKALESELQKIIVAHLDTNSNKA